jgi:hypothetical protein
LPLRRSMRTSGMGCSLIFARRLRGRWTIIFVLSILGRGFDARQRWNP